MKKQSAISLLLGLSLLLSSLVLPVSAQPLSLTEPVEVTEETTAPPTDEAQTGETQTSGTGLTSSAAHLPFGQASVQMGCRTLDGMMPLAGSERRLATSQGVFAYEVNSGTVIYSYNPDVKLSPGS